MNRLVPHLRRAALMGLTDRELLEALVTRRDETAFEVLLRRHGPMVLAVCRRVLRNSHDAEDAFQATFLVLIRKAATVQKRDALGCWLYGVAYRTAQKARTMNTRRRNREQHATPRPPRPETSLSFDLDDELNALPEKYRVPVVLCELEGRSRKEVARQLNVPEGTLSSRLAAARKTLAKRLREHGWSGAAPAVLPPLLLTSTRQAGAQLLAGRPATGVVSAEVLALTQGVLKAMFVNKLKALTLVLILAGLVGAGARSFGDRALAESPTAAAQEPPAKDPRVQEASADVAAAQAALKQAEANLAAARAQLALKEAVYQQALANARLPFEKEKFRAAASDLMSRFKYRIPVEVGLTQRTGGARVEILEVWGTQPEIVEGGYYLVHGKYALPAGMRGKLYFYETATEGWNNSGPVLDLQTTAANGSGEFTLLHNMAGPGYFHLLLEGPAEGRTTASANVYFGTGKTVYREEK
jgi:RNA polymerase sigma factor (sigma-70 family)